MNKDIKNMAEVLFDITEGKSEKEIKAVTKDFIKLLAKKNLISKSNQIITEYQKLKNKKDGVVSATITTIAELDPKEKNKITEYIKSEFSADKIEIMERVDSRILGGVRIQVGDSVIDNSVRARLSKLENILMK